MKSREDQTEPEIDKKITQGFPSHDQPSQTNGNGHRPGITLKSNHVTPPRAPASPTEKIFHNLAKLFNGLHWTVGITTLPATATPREERSFVLMWLGIILFVIVFLAGFFYLLGRM